MPTSTATVLDWVAIVGRWRGIDYGNPRRRILIVPVPDNNFDDAMLELVRAKAGDRVPKLVRVRHSWRLRLREIGGPTGQYMPPHVEATLYTVDGRGVEYQVYDTILSEPGSESAGERDDTERYSVPPLGLRPYRAELTLRGAEYAIVEVYTVVSVEWGW